MKNIMHLRYFFFAIVVVGLVLFASYSIPASIVPPTIPTSGVQNATEEHVEIPTEVGALKATTKNSALPLDEPTQNGLSILESHCAQCHTTQSLIKTKKTRTEWEKTLARMERMGVHLRDTEKVVLIDYLVSNVEP